MMKAISGIVVVLWLLLWSAAAYSATVSGVNFRALENTLAERIDGLCSYAENTNEAGLSDLEKFLAGEIKAMIDLEEAERNRWNRTEGFLERYVYRRAYLLALAKATYFIELSSRVRQCIQARRISFSRIQLSILPPPLWRTSMIRPLRLKTG